MPVVGLASSDVDGVSVCPVAPSQTPVTAPIADWLAGTRGWATKQGATGLALRLYAMANIYDAMVGALREHWNANSNAYPQRFELMPSTFESLVAERRLVNQSMNFPLILQKANWEGEFLGVAVQAASEGNVMVAADGTRVPLEA